MKFHSRLLYGVLGLCTLISLSCTSENAGVDEEKLSVAFVQNEISIPIYGEVTAVLEVSPESRADEAETRADEEKSRADKYEKILKEHGLL